MISLGSLQVPQSTAGRDGGAVGEKKGEFEKCLNTCLSDGSCEMFIRLSYIQTSQQDETPP